MCLMMSMLPHLNRFLTYESNAKKADYVKDCMYCVRYKDLCVHILSIKKLLSIKAAEKQLMIKDSCEK